MHTAPCRVWNRDTCDNQTSSRSSRVFRLSSPDGLDSPLPLVYSQRPPPSSQARHPNRHLPSELRAESPSWDHPMLADHHPLTLPAAAYGGY
ncbi:hypothetical protein LX36DRAFT_660649 [Colletotrichum falcatum]|nr:hypothetical protein LX36DRAFT_660649 [Colletotrichum falcatum]